MSIEYDNGKNFDTVFDSENRPIVLLLYNHVGNMIQIRPAVDTVVAFNVSYDAFGRLLSKSWGQKKLMQLYYDQEGRLLQWNAKKFNYLGVFRKVIFDNFVPGNAISGS